jgi:hypothetical protein
MTWLGDSVGPDPVEHIDGFRSRFAQRTLDV